MAGPTVTLTFAGDTKDLDKAFSTASSGADKMAKDVSSSSRKAHDDAGGALGHIGEKADESESKFQGMADTITGFSDVATGFKDGDVVTMATGFADIAGGVTDFVVPALLTLKGVLLETVIPAVWGFTSALLANPITWVVIGIIALIAVIVLMVTHWDTVKEVVTTVVNWIVDKWNWVVDQVKGIATAIWTWITDKVGGAWRWVQDRALDFYNWITGLPGRIGNALGSLGGFIGNAFKAGINAAIGWLNWGIDKINGLIYGINVINPFGDIPYIPHIPRFHTGGLVPGTQGSEMLAVLQAGERVIPKGQAGGGGNTTVRFVGNTSDALATVIMQMIRTGQIQLEAA